MTQGKLAQMSAPETSSPESDHRGLEIYLEGVLPSRLPLMYDRDGLNCLLVPLLLAAGGLSRPLHEVGLLSFYSRSHYPYWGDQTDIGCPLRGPEELLALQSKVLKPWSIEIDVVPVEGDLVRAVTRQLKRDKYVVVPVDKGSLPYTRSHFLDKHGGHFMLVKGYVGRKGLFVVHDGEHVEMLTNADFFSPHEENRGDALPGESWKYTAPWEPTHTLREVIGDVYAEFYVPTDYLLVGYDAYNQAAPFFHESILTIASEASELPNEQALLNGAREELIAIVNAIESGAKSFALKQRILEERDASEAYFTLQYVNSQRLLGVAARFLLERLGANAEAAREVERAAASTSAAWRSLSIGAAASRLSQGGLSPTVIREPCIQEARLGEKLRHALGL